MRLLLTLFYSLPLCLVAQFAPAVGQLGCSAIYKDSSAIQSWADSCKVYRGWKDIANKNLGKVSFGKDSAGIGSVNISNGVVSLGDSGVVICYFKDAISNGIGEDFAVFENSFDGLFLELAFVEVSTDGLHYARFPAQSKTDTTLQIDGFGQIIATKIHNFAGKYKVDYGTPFDLEEIQNDSFINKDSIHYVKLIDVVGSIQNNYCSKDKDHNKINDPYPTPFISGGFDLDAIGVIHQKSFVNLDKKNSSHKKIVAFPTICNHEITITGLKKYYTNTLTIRSIENRIIEKIKTEEENIQLNVAELSKGMYIFEINNTERIFYIKIIKI